MAAARSLRRFAQRLRETLACAGTMPSRVWRISARSSGISAGRRPVSLAKVATADRRSRLRVSGRLLPAIRSLTSCSVAGAAVGGIGSCFMAFAPLRTVGVPTGRERPGGDIRELYHGTDGTFV